MDFEIDPFISAGPITLGMSRLTVRNIFNSSPTSFLKGIDDTVETDFFEIEGVFIFYDDDYNCIAIELTSPSAPLFKKKNLLKLSLKEAKIFFGDDKSLVLEEDGYTSSMYGIGAYYEHKKSAETIIVFIDGYYDMGEIE